MRASSILSTALLVGVSVALLASRADAQSAARYAAIEKCIAQAQAQWPNLGNNGNERNRTASYKACMKAAGQRP
jgi:hypothetical protein